MTEFFNCVFSVHGLAYLTGALIFFLTLFLSAKHIIGLGVTFIFLLFAIIASQLIANQEAIKKYFNNFYETTPSSSYKAENSPPPEKTDINRELQKAFDDLKAEFMEEKEKLQRLYEDFNKKNSDSTEPKKSSSHPYDS